MSDSSASPEQERFVAGVECPPHAGPGWWFVVRDSDVLVRTETGSESFPHLTDPTELGLRAPHRHYLGLLDGRPCHVAALAEAETPPDGWTLAGLRSLFGRVEDTTFWVAARAVQIAEWDRNHRFCGHCGSPTHLRAGERAMECLQCGLTAFPRVAPAVIVLIERGDEVLLARSHRFTGEIYSVIAGFVEPGETLEQAAAREIMEEVGLRVKNLRYFGSQPWPFPHSLMVAFTCEYAEGEIRIEPKEIAEAAWFRHDRMPRIPGAMSVARRLIEAYLAKHGQ
jgi:NAD+ diphosphatase